VRILIAAIAVVSCVLGSCAARDPVVSSSDVTTAGNWRIERAVDRITGAPISSALLGAASSHSAEPFPKRVLMQLACFNKVPVVRFGFEVKVGTSRNAELGYRFDEKPGHEIKAHFVNDDKAAVIEGPTEVSQFVSEMASSNQLYLRIRSLSFGRTATEFHLDGAPAAIAAGFAGCQPGATAKPR